MDAEFSYRALANLRGVSDSSLRDLDYLLRDQFGERIVAVLEAKDGQRALISGRQAPDLIRTHREFLEQRINRHGALPGYAGGSAIGLSATDAYGIALSADDARTIPGYRVGCPGKGTHHENGIARGSGIKKSPAREAGAGRATINRTCRLTLGMHRRHCHSVLAIRLFPAKVRNLRTVSNIIRTNPVERCSCKCACSAGSVCEDHPDQPWTGPHAQRLTQVPSA